VSLAALSAQRLLELGGLKARCSAKVRCVAHGLSLPCDLCDLEGGAGPGVVCETCGHHFAQGLLATSERPCQSVAEFTRTRKIAFEDEARAALLRNEAEQQRREVERQRRAEAERQAAERLRAERERHAAEEAARETALEAEASRIRAEEAERARQERERHERAALEAAHTAEVARGSRRASWSLWAAFTSSVVGAAWVWSMPFVNPPKSTGYLVGYAVLVLLMLGLSVSPLLGTEQAHRSLKRFSPVTWALVGFAWPAVAALVLCLLVAKFEFSLQYAVASFVGGLLLPSLVIVTCSHVGTALSMSAPWPRLVGADFKGMRSPWIWVGLLLTLGLNGGLIAGKAHRFDDWFIATDNGSTPALAPATAASVDPPSGMPVPKTIATEEATIPAAAGLVTDVAAALTPEDIEYLQARLGFLPRSGATARVLLVPTTGLEPIDSFGRRVGSAWNAAGAESHADILIAVAINDLTVTINVSRTLNETLTYTEVQRHIDSHFSPAAKKAGIAEGLMLLVDRIERTLATVRHARVDESRLRTATLQAVQSIADGVHRWDGKQPTLSAIDAAAVDSAIAQLEAMPRPSRGDRQLARRLHANGLSLIGQSGFEALAAEKMLLAHQADPLDVQIVNDLAFAEMSAGRHVAATNYLLATLRLAPTRTSAWVNLAETVPFIGTSGADAIRTATDLYLAGYWFSKDRAKTVEYLRGRSEAPEAMGEVRAAAASALRRLDAAPPNLVPGEAAPETPTTTGRPEGRLIEGADSSFSRFIPSAEQKSARDAATTQAAEAATRVLNLVIHSLTSNGVNIPSAGQLLTEPRIVAAISARDQAIGKVPTNRLASSALLKRAQDLLTRQGSAQQVVDLLGEAVAEDPFNGPMLDAVTAALWRVGKRDEAVRIALWRYVIDPLRPASLIQWVETASSSGETPPDKAGAMMAVAFALSGEDPVVLARLKEIGSAGPRKGKASEAALQAIAMIESEQWQQRSRPTARN